MSFSTSYDASTKRTCAILVIVLAAIAMAIPSLIVGCLGAQLLLAVYSWSPRGYRIADRSCSSGAS